MNPRTRFAAALLLAGSASASQATVYDVSAVFSDGGVQGYTTFNGSFDWDGSTVSNFTGFLSESMWEWNTADGTFTSGANGAGMKATGYTGEVYNQAYTNGDAPLLDLTYQLATSTSGNMVTVTTFLQNSTDVVSGGGYDVVSSNNALAYGYPTDADRNYNAFFTLEFNASDITNTAAAVNGIVYGDETPLGLMGPMLTGWVGMTAYEAGGSMGGAPLSLTITEVSAVPVPAAAWLFGSAMLGAFGMRSRKAAC